MTETKVKFLPVKGYDRYLIDENGNAIVACTGAVVPWHKSNGYLFSRLVNNNGVRRSVGQHRAIALAYLDKPVTESRLTVNHKNGIKNDNRVDNLEWVTYSENNRHAYDTGLRKDSIHVSVTNLSTGLKNYFSSVSRCLEYFNWNACFAVSRKGLEFVYRNHRVELLKEETSLDSSVNVYPNGLLARNIETNVVSFSLSADSLGKIVGLHPKVIRIVRTFRFQYPTNGYDIRAASDDIQWPVYSIEEIEAYKVCKFIYQPVVVTYPNGVKILVGSVLNASAISKTCERSIRFCLTNNVPCVNGFGYQRYTRTMEINA